MHLVVLRVVKQDFKMHVINVLAKTRRILSLHSWHKQRVMKSNYMETTATKYRTRNNMSSWKHAHRGGVLAVYLLLNHFC